MGHCEICFLAVDIPMVKGGLKFLQKAGVVSWFLGFGGSNYEIPKDRS